MSFIRAKEIPPRSGNWYDYEVKLYRRKSVKRGKPVLDATLTPVVKGVSQNE